MFRAGLESSDVVEYGIGRNKIGRMRFAYLEG